MDMGSPCLSVRGRRSRTLTALSAPGVTPQPVRAGGAPRPCRLEFVAVKTAAAIVAAIALAAAVWWFGIRTTDEEDGDDDSDVEDDGTAASSNVSQWGLRGYALDAANAVSAD